VRTLFRSRVGQQLVHAQYRALLDSWPVAHEELRVPTCQGETFIVASGPARAPPVLLLHGGGATSAMWARNIAAWSERLRVYAVDIIGEAGFSTASRPRLNSDGHARWLDDIGRALSLGQTGLVGASLGGLIALDYAIRRPALVRCLALLAPAGMVRPRLLPMLRIVPVFLLGAWGRRRAFHMLMGFDPRELDATSAPFIHLFELTFQHFVLRPLPMLAFAHEALRSVKLPVMVVMGGKDHVFSASQMRHRLGRCVPQARVIYLPEAGHGLTDQTESVRAFLLEASADRDLTGPQAA
jgi:pimeloyl-ACP methyl ester carboxylesterase